MSLFPSHEIKQPRTNTTDADIKELLFGSTLGAELEQSPTTRIIRRLGLVIAATVVLGVPVAIAESKLMQSEGVESTPRPQEQSLLRTAPLPPRTSTAVETTILPSVHTTDQARRSKQSTHHKKRHHIHRRKQQAPQAPAPAVRVVAAAPSRPAPVSRPAPTVPKPQPHPKPKPKPQPKPQPQSAPQPAAPEPDWTQSKYYQYGDDGPCYGDNGERYYCY